MAAPESVDLNKLESSESNLGKSDILEMYDEPDDDPLSLQARRHEVAHGARIIQMAAVDGDDFLVNWKRAAYTFIIHLTFPFCIPVHAAISGWLLCYNQFFVVSNPIAWLIFYALPPLSIHFLLYVICRYKWGYHCVPAICGIFAFVCHRLAVGLKYGMMPYAVGEILYICVCEEERYYKCLWGE